MNENSNITMKDIARELNISVSTVSRALKDSPRISIERRRMIQQYAQEHHFMPNMLAESLRLTRVQPMKIIGVIIPEFVHYYFSTVFSPRLVAPHHVGTKDETAVTVSFITFYLYSRHDADRDTYGAGSCVFF